MPIATLSLAARRTLRDVGRVVDLRTYAWTCLKSFPHASEDAARELETLGYLAKYAEGWKITTTGVSHLLTTEEPDPDEHHPRAEHPQAEPPQAL